MAVEVIMPKVDMDMTTGTLAAWHVAEGERVEKGAALFDIETNKAAMEVESPASGHLHHVTAGPGAVVAVGSPVAWIYADGEAVGAAPGGTKAVIADVVRDAGAQEADAPPPEDTLSDAPRPGAADAAKAPTAGATVRATPAARRLAREKGVELSDVPGTGPQGRIQEADVAAATAVAEAPARPTPSIDQRERKDSAASPRRTPQSPDSLHISRRSGQGTPLFLLHGFAADAAGWAPLERALPADMPLLRLDLPNHGRSPLRPATDFRDLARTVISAFDSSGVEKVHLLGHSLGGALALALADIRPRQVETLTLLCPAGLGPEIDGPALAGIARASRAESLAPWLKRLTASEDRLGWDFVKAAMLARVDSNLRDAQSALAEVLFPDGVQAFDLRAALGRVEAPTALIWGRKDRIVPWKHGLVAPGEIALHLLHDVGHIPHVEVPEKVARIVARLVGRSERSD